MFILQLLSWIGHMSPCFKLIIKEFSSWSHCKIKSPQTSPCIFFLGKLKKHDILIFKNTIAVGKKVFQLYKKCSNYTNNTFKWCHYFFTILMDVKGSMCLLQTGLKTIAMSLLLSTCITASAFDIIWIFEKKKLTFYSTSLDKTGTILSSQSRTLLLKSVSFTNCCASKR